MITEKIKEQKIDLPNAPDPVGAYVAYKISGNLLFISGQLPIGKDGKMIKGKIGKDLSPVKNVKPLWSRFGLYASLALGGLDMWVANICGVNIFGTMKHIWTTMKNNAINMKYI